MNRQIVAKIGFGSIILSWIASELIARIIAFLIQLSGPGAMMVGMFIICVIRPLCAGIISTVLFQLGINKWLSDSQSDKTEFTKEKAVIVCASVSFSILYAVVSISLTGILWP